MGIHYDYKSTKGNKLMEKQAKREKKLAEKKAKRLAKEGPKQEEAKTKNFGHLKKPIIIRLPDKSKQRMNSKDKNERLSLALKKNLKKRKTFSKKN